MGARRSVRAAAVAIALLAAACGGGDGDDREAALDGADLRETTTTTTAPKPVQGGTVTIGVRYGVADLDPAKGSLGDIEQVDAALAVFDPLIERDDDGGFRPGLATEWSASEDLMTWTLALRDDVVFSDGSPVDAEAVVAHVHRLQGPECSCLQEVSAITSVEAPEPATVVFRLAAPDPNFLSLLAGTSGLVTAVGPNGAAIGTGAFTVAGTDPLVLARNPRHWRRDADGRPLPRLDEVRFVPYPEVTERVAAVRAGEVDLAHVDEYEDVPEASDGVEVALTAGPPRLLFLDVTEPPFDDVRVRRAVAAGIDRDALVTRAYHGTRQPAPGLLPPGSRWDTGVRWPAFDPERAADLVAEIGPVDAEVTCRAHDEARRLYSEVTRQLQAAGMGAESRFLDAGEHVNLIFSGAREFDATCFGGPVLLDADELATMFRSGEPNNISGYENPTVDRALDDLERTGDEDEQRRLLEVVLQQLAEDVPVVPLVLSGGASVHRDDVHGLVPAGPAWSGSLRLADLFRTR